VRRLLYSHRTERRTNGVSGQDLSPALLLEAQQQIESPDSSGAVSTLVKIQCVSLADRRSGLERINGEFTAALLGFNGEAVVYCQGISDIVAQEYAVEYTRILQNRAKAIETQPPRIPARSLRAESQLDPFHAGADVGKAFSEELSGPGSGSRARRNA
jgi:hypothetical protein